MKRFISAIAIFLGKKAEPSTEKIILDELERQHRLSKMSLDAIKKSSCFGGEVVGCHYCGGSGTININTSDNSFGFLSEFLNIYHCPYCEKGRELKRAFEERMGKHKDEIIPLSADETYEVLGIRK